MGRHKVCLYIPLMLLQGSETIEAISARLPRSLRSIAIIFLFFILPSEFCLLSSYFLNRVTIFTIYSILYFYTLHAVRSTLVLLYAVRYTLIFLVFVLLDFIISINYLFFIFLFFGFRLFALFTFFSCFLLLCLS